MNDPDEILVNLNARVPRDLWRRMKHHCIATDTTVLAFVRAAIVERLKRESARKGS